MCTIMTWGTHEYFMHPIFVLKMGVTISRPSGYTRDSSVSRRRRVVVLVPRGLALDPDQSAACVRYCAIVACRVEMKQSCRVAPTKANCRHIAKK
jgi:hypothetical protein